MSIQRHDLRTKAPQKYGKPTISYPAGNTAFPKIVEVRTAKKGTDSALLIPFLTAHRDRASFPNALLTEQVSDGGDDTDKNITETYETLPGPVVVEISADQDTGMPVLVSKQKRAATDIFNEGELVIAAIDILSITAGNPSTVTLNVSGLTPAAHFLAPRQWVTIAGTGTALDGNQRILAAPNDQQITFAVDVVAGAGSGGTVTPINRVVRECKPTENINVNVKIDSMIAAVDVTAYNEDLTNVWKEYSFPDFLLAIRGYKDLALSTVTALTEWGLTITGGGSVGMQIQNGYRGPCKAQRLRLYGMGPSAMSSALSGYNIILVIPSSGTYVIESESISTQVNTTSGEGQAFSYTFKNGTIPPVLTPGLVGNLPVNKPGQAQFFVPPPRPPGSAPATPSTSSSSRKSCAAACGRSMCGC